MLPDEPVPLADDTRGCVLESKTRKIQDGSRVYQVSLNRDWLQSLGIGQQGAPTVHSVAMRPVEIRYPAYIIQPADEVLDP